MYQRSCGIGKVGVVGAPASFDHKEEGREEPTNHATGGALQASEQIQDFPEGHFMPLFQPC
jgi:hypothetical protein